MQGYLQHVLLLSCEGNTEQKARLLCPQALQKGGWTSRGPQCHVKAFCGIYLASLDVLLHPFFPDLLQCGNTLLVTPVCEGNQIVSWLTLTLKNSFARRYHVQPKMAGMPRRTQQ